MEEKNTKLSESLDLASRLRIKPLTREQVADFVRSREAELRTIARSKISARARSVHDSEDIFSSVLRRLDKMAHDGAVRPRSESELWALASTIAKNCATTRTRMFARATALEAEDGEYSRLLGSSFRNCQSDDEATLLLLRLGSCLEHSEDRQLLFLRMRGASYDHISYVLGVQPDALRRRWMAVKARLSALLQSGIIDG